MIKLLYPRGGSFTASAADSATVKLSPQSNSGKSGTASLIKQGEKQTKVTLDVIARPAPSPSTSTRAPARSSIRSRRSLSGGQRKVGDRGERFA
jgi:hypothetical protein